MDKKDEENIDNIDNGNKVKDNDEEEYTDVDMGENNDNIPKEDNIKENINDIKEKKGDEENILNNKENNFVANEENKDDDKKSDPISNIKTINIKKYKLKESYYEFDNKEDNKEKRRRSVDFDARKRPKQFNVGGEIPYTKPRASSLKKSKYNMHSLAGSFEKKQF